MARMRSSPTSAASTALGLVLGFAALGAAAQDLYQWETYDKRVDSTKTVQKLGDDLFGDSISLQDGVLSFSVTDVSIPGNNALPVAITRGWTLSNTRGQAANRLMADWQVSLPRITGQFADQWLTAGTSTQRCSDTRGPAVPSDVVGIFDISAFWNGIRLEVPGGGGDLLLTAAGVAKPTDGRNYVWVTGDGQTHVSCIPSIKNGSGEGFHAVTPDGTRYTFDWMARRSIPRIFRKSKDPAGATIIYRMPIHEYSLYATRVEDRHGNWVEYTYTNAATDLPRLTRIHASDGRELTIGYSNTPRITSVSDGSRTWSYTYGTDGAGRPRLSVVTRPDNSTWQINFSALSHTPIIPQYDGDDHSCLSLATPENLFSEVEGSIVHPSGAVGTFHVGIREHGRSNVTLSCSGVTTTPSTAPPGTGNDPLDDVNLFVVSAYSWSLLRKEITGPGLPSMVWTYDYSSDIWAHLYPGTTPDFPVCIGAQCFQPACTSDACAGTAQTFIVRPDGHWERYVFGNSWQYNEGKLLRIERGSSDGAVLETVEQGFDLARTNRNYPARYGTSLRINVDGFQTEFHRPQWSNTITRDSAVFQWSVGTCGPQRCFDAQARPTQIQRSSQMGHGSPNYSKTETLTYYDHAGKWVRGQLASKWVDGIEVARGEYDSSTANLLRVFQYGRRMQTLAYNADGTVASATDARNFTTTLGNWYRGVPRAIGYPDGTSQSAVVNTQGWVTSVTDQNGFETGYGYDALGRLSSLTPPTGDTVAWAGTTIGFSRAVSSAYGLPAGHWQRTETRGNYRKITYFDGLWRPVIEREWDNADVTGTQRFRAWSYDTAGRLAFEGDPRSTATGIGSFTTGTSTLYDALGRPTTVSRSSELGTLTTRYAYLPGFRQQVTDPRGNSTVTRYLAYDQPVTDWPMVIAGPGGVDTSFHRDVFGKPETITRSGPGVSVTRHYVYDGDQRLCKQVEPETRASVFGYDAAGNLSWSAAGISLSTARSCDREWIGSAEKTVRHYDAMNRVTLVDFPDATVDIATTYTPDGLVSTLGAGPHVWKYTYNRLRLPTRELLEHTYQGLIYPYPVDWAYNALGHRTSFTSGITVDYAPNALGQPTRAGTFATGATYFPDGQLKGFTYGNGSVRSIEQNTRRLPSRIADIRSGVTILDDRFTWDANGNLTNQDDQLNLAGGDRSLTYDARDRLLSAQISGAPTETFSYDVLDNLSSRQWGSQVSSYHYNAEWQLASISGLNPQSFSYDVRGNQTGRGGRTQVFDRANRLLSVSGAGGASYEYDGHGRRTMSWRQNGTGKMDVYSLDGVLRYTSDNARGGATVYVHLGTQLVAERFAHWNGTNVAITYVHGDLVGSSVARTDSTGAIIERERSYSFGQALDGSKREAPGFTGHMEDPGTGLVYMQQRYYDPAIGRFLSVDPVGPLDNPINHFGRYHYANNNPYKYVDPDGRIAFLIPVAVIAWRAYSAYDTVTTAADNISTVADSSASTGDRVLAGAELLGSVVGGKAGRTAVGGVARMADDAVDASRRVPMPTAGGGAKIENIAAGDALRIQNAADRTGTTVTVVGSRASGTATSASDWDYVVDANAPTRNSISRSLPGAGNVSEGVRPNIDVFKGSVDKTKPHIEFKPEQKR